MKNLSLNFMVGMLGLSLVGMGAGSAMAQESQGAGSSHRAHPTTQTVRSSRAKRRISSNLRAQRRKQGRPAATLTRSEARHSGPRTRTRVASAPTSTEMHVANPLKPAKFVTVEPKQEAIEPQRIVPERRATTNGPLSNLTTPLQQRGLLPVDIGLKDACTHFKTLNDCVAALHASQNLGLNFNCMKWDLTGVPLTADPSACAVPGSRNIMTLSKAIQALKPDAFGKEEALTAQKQAYNDLKDAGLGNSKNLQ